MLKYIQNLLSKHRVFVCILIIGALFRIIPFDKGIKDGDEFTTKLIATGISDTAQIKENNYFTTEDLKNNNLQNVIRLTIADNGNSLVYNIVLHYWLKVFGGSDNTARALSLISFLLFSIILYFFIVSYSTKNLAYISLLFIAVNPVFIEYSYIARAYMFSLMLITLSSVMFYSIVNAPKTKDSLIIGYYIVSILAVFSHYFTGFILCFHIIYLALQKRDINLWKRLLMYFSIVIAVFLLWYIFIGKEAFEVLGKQNEYKADILTNNAEMSWYEVSNISSISFNLFKVYLAVTGLNIYWELLGMGIKFRYLLIFISIPIVLMIIFLINLVKNKENRQFKVFLLLMSVASIFFNISLAVKSGFTGALTLRYFLFSLPYIIIIMSYACRQLSFNNKKNILLASVIAILLIVNICSALQINKEYKVNEIEKFANEIKKYKTENILIIFSNEYTAKLFNSYINNNKKLNQIYIKNENNKGNIRFVINNDTIHHNIKCPKDYWFLK